MSEYCRKAAARPGDGLPVNVIKLGSRALLIGIGSNQGGVDRRAIS
jgi:hypothetical protein